MRDGWQRIVWPKGARSPGNTRAAAKTASQRGDDPSHCLPSKWVSDVQTFLSKTRLRLLVRRVSTSGELFSFRAAAKRSVDGLDVLSLQAHLGTCSGISFVDSTRLRVCDNKRISAHRVFAKEAGCSKTSMGWFCGFKLHLVINDAGEILDVELTPGNTDDRRPLPKFAEGLHGSLYGDRGYISKDLRERLGAQGVNLVYKVRKNMDPLDLSVADKVLLKKRMLIESVIKILKTQTQLEHTRHRSYANFQVNVVSALIAYQLLENKPSLNFSELQQINDLSMLSNP